MAIRRTLKDKQKALERRETTTFTWTETAPTSSTPTEKKIPTSGVIMPENILGYPLKLIYSDITKTIVFSVALVVVLVALFIWWK